VLWLRDLGELKHTEMREVDENIETGHRQHTQDRCPWNRPACFAKISKFSGVKADFHRNFSSCTGDLAAYSSGPSDPLNVILREPLSGTYNTFEFTAARTLLDTALQDAIKTPELGESKESPITLQRRAAHNALIVRVVPGPGLDCWPGTEKSHCTVEAV
jgi:hypothetical protein